MLIEFNVTNFRSFKTKQTFTMVNSKVNLKEDELPDNTFTFQKNSFLKSSAIYGANASGKSNFLLAIETMENLVLNSTKESKRGDQWDVTPFRLSKNTRNEPSEFEVMFISENIRYQYGFSVSSDKILEEWLIAYPTGRPQHWFSRKWNEKTKVFDWHIGSKLKGRKQMWQDATRDNALFLSTAVDLNSVQLQPVYDWFKNTLHVLTDPDGWGSRFSTVFCLDERKSEIADYLIAADTGIEGIHAEENPFDPSILPDDLPDDLREQLAMDLKGKKFIRINTLHADEDGEPVYFDLKEESTGTRKLFSFAGPWIDALSKGSVLFIDELHSNLHPKIVRFLVELFHDKSTNPKNAQLIFTTHETSILSQDIFRRDQIWFCEKDKNQATELFSLTDFSPRKGRENLERAYLSGRYGAVPFVRPLQRKS